MRPVSTSVPRSKRPSGHCHRIIGQSSPSSWSTICLWRKRLGSWVRVFYKRSLMSDMDADDFADTYAQTLTYALFLTRLEKGPITDLEAAWKAIPTDVLIMRSAIEPLRAAGKIPDPLAAAASQPMIS
jgi:hypothetical protein